MPDPNQTQKRVNVMNLQTGERKSLPADQVVSGMDSGWFPVDAGGTIRPESPSVWHWANRGLLTPDQVLRMVGRPDVQTLERPVGLAGATTPTQIPAADRQRLMQATQAKQVYSGPRITAPEASIYSRFWPQMDVQMARYLSAGTSPASLATMGLGALAQFPRAVAGVGGPLASTVGAIGRGARGVRTGLGLAYGGQGAMEALDAWQDPSLSAAERAERVLGGASQTVGGIPAAGELRSALTNFVSSRFPLAAPQGEDAFVGALNPPKEEVRAVRAAYRRIKPDLVQANIGTLSELKDHSGQQKLEAAQELNRRLAAANPQATYLSPRQTAIDLRNLVTPFMRRQTTALGQRNPTRRFLERKASDMQVEMTRKPMDIEEAEQLVQNINQELATFHQLPPERQQVGLTEADIMYRQGLHDSLQNQIEQRMSGYRDLKLRYGAYKDLQRAAQNRQDELAKKLGAPDALMRRIWEGLGGSAAALMRGDLFRGVGEILAGRTLGDIMARRGSDPSHLLELSLRTPRPGMRPLPRSLIAVAQPVVAGALQSAREFRPTTPSAAQPTAQRAAPAAPVTQPAQPSLPAPTTPQPPPSAASQSTRALMEQRRRDLPPDFRDQPVVQLAPQDVTRVLEKAAFDTGIDSRLLQAMRGQESGGFPGAVSDKKAMGDMQLMPETARRLKVKNPFDPRENIPAGARLMQDLLTRYKGNLSFALAAYNSNPAAVDRYGGIPPFQQTQEYVRAVMARYRALMLGGAQPTRATSTAPAGPAFGIPGQPPAPLTGGQP